MTLVSLDDSEVFSSEEDRCELMDILVGPVAPYDTSFGWAASLICRLLKFHNNEVTIMNPHQLN
jgi:hypothetical protein